MKLKILESYKKWIIDLRPTDGGWLALVHPDKVYEAKELETIIKWISIHVADEVEWLVKDALNVKFELPKEKPVRSTRPVSDIKMIIASILYDKFPLTHKHISKIMQWNNHASSIKAIRSVEEIRELIEMKKKVLKTYPFLNGCEKPIR